MPMQPCPLCNKRYSAAFLPLHAGACGLPTKRAIKKPRRKPSTQLPLSLPNLRTQPPLSFSEKGAPGFHVFLGAIPPALQADLLRRLEATSPAWRDFRFRQTKNYGPAYDLRRRRFLFGPGAPPFTQLPPYATHETLPLVRALHPVLAGFRPNQLAVGKYLVPGGHILPHNDCENATIHTAVVGVCLGGACTMTLILRGRYSGRGRDTKHDIRLPPGTVYAMTGDALRVWEHAIFPGKTERERISLTFRDVSPLPNEVEGTQKTFKEIGRPSERYRQSRLP